MEPIGDAMALEIRHLRSEVARLTEEVQEKLRWFRIRDSLCDKQTLEIATKDEQIASLAEGCRSREKALAEAGKQIASLKASLIETVAKVHSDDLEYLRKTEAEISTLKADLTAADEEVAALREQISNWRVTAQLETEARRNAVVENAHLKALVRRMGETLKPLEQAARQGAAAIGMSNAWYPSRIREADKYAALARECEELGK
jgi:chromosome segregation ATPase